MCVRKSVWPVAVAALVVGTVSPSFAAQRGRGGAPAGGHGGARTFSVGGGSRGGFRGGGNAGGGFRGGGIPGGGFRGGGFNGGGFRGGVDRGLPPGVRRVTARDTSLARIRGTGRSAFNSWFPHGGFNNPFFCWNGSPWWGGFCDLPFYGGFGGFGGFGGYPFYSGLSFGYPFYGSYAGYGGYPYSPAASYVGPSSITRNEVYYLTPMPRARAGDTPENPATAPPQDTTPPKQLTPVPKEHDDHAAPALSPLELVRRQLRVEDADAGVYLVRWSAPAGKVATVELRALDADRKPLDTRTFKEAPYRGLLKVPAETKRVEVTVESPDGASLSLQLPIEDFKALADE